MQTRPPALTWDTCLINKKLQEINAYIKQFHGFRYKNRVAILNTALDNCKNLDNWLEHIETFFSEVKSKENENYPIYQYLKTILLTAYQQLGSFYKEDQLKVKLEQLQNPTKSLRNQYINC